MGKLQILHTFLYYYGVGPYFAFSTAAILLGMDSYKFEQSQGEFYTILLVEHLQVALEMLEVEMCSSLQSPKVNRIVQ
jgi:hypothetical protein